MDGIEQEVTEGGNLDIDMPAALDSLASDLGLGSESPADGTATPTPDGGKGAQDEVVSPAPSTDAPARKAVPQSWAKEAHPLWDKLDDATRDVVIKREKDFLDGIETYKADSTYGKQFRDVVAPYEPWLQAAGIKNPVDGVKELLNAHVQLSHADETVRTNFMARLLATYRIDPAKLVQPASTEEIDPRLKQLTEKVDNLTQSQQQEHQRRQQELRGSIDKQVSDFWSDKTAHPYADEVAKDMALLLADPQMTLEEAYKRAVRANPTTWAKEEARIREETEKSIRDEAKKKADAAKRSKGTVVTNAGEKSSTAVVGSIDDTLRETYRNIQSRTDN